MSKQVVRTVVSEGEARDIRKRQLDARTKYEKAMAAWRAATATEATRRAQALGEIAGLRVQKDAAKVEAIAAGCVVRQ